MLKDIPAIVFMFALNFSYPSLCKRCGDIKKSAEMVPLSLISIQEFLLSSSQNHTFSSIAFPNASKLMNLSTTPAQSPLKYRSFHRAPQLLYLNQTSSSSSTPQTGSLNAR